MSPKLLAVTLWAALVSAAWLAAWAASPQMPAAPPPMPAAPPPMPAAPPPMPAATLFPVIVPDTAQGQLQTQIAIQQAQGQASLAASQATIQSQLDAYQARLEGQVAAEEGKPVTTPPAPLEVPLAFAVPSRAPFAGPLGTMELATLSRKLGRYFDTRRGVLVVRAPAHGVLKLEDGDVILAIGERVPADSAQAIRMLASYDPGQKVRLSILRDHHRINITATMPGPTAGR